MTDKSQFQTFDPLEVAIDLAQQHLAKLIALRPSLAVSKARDEFLAADYCEDDLIEAGTAAARFEIPKDMLRRWCRDEGCGVKRGGRWMVSLSQLRRRLGQ